MRPPYPLPVALTHRKYLIDTVVVHNGGAQPLPGSSWATPPRSERKRCPMGMSSKESDTKRDEETLGGIPQPLIRSIEYSIDAPDDHVGQEKADLPPVPLRPSSLLEVSRDGAITIFRQEAPGGKQEGDEEPEEAPEEGQTRERLPSARIDDDEECDFQVEFGIRAPNLPRQKRTRLFVQARTFHIPHRHTFLIKLRLLSLDKDLFPGALTISFRRLGGTGSGTLAAPADIVLRAQSLEELQDGIDEEPAPEIGAPLAADGSLREEAETIWASAKWDADDGTSCGPIEDFLTIRWLTVGRSKTPYPEDRQRIPKEETYTSFSEEIVLRPGPDAGDTVGVPIETYFHVPEVGVCCGEERGHAVIQFVRHRSYIRDLRRLNPPIPEGDPLLSDEWSLDILEEQIENANENPQEPYDPTYTHRPLGQGSSAPIVYSGPNAHGELSVVQEDAPGLGRQLFRRLHREGGFWRWEFLTLLVCKIDQADSREYLEDGLVTEFRPWWLEIRFRGTSGLAGDVGTPPVVSHGVGAAKRLKACQNLEDFLRSADRKNGLGSDPGEPVRKGSLLDGYVHPTTHRVAYPAPP